MPGKTHFEFIFFPHGEVEIPNSTMFKSYNLTVTALQLKLVLKQDQVSKTEKQTHGVEGYSGASACLGSFY